jgi:DUF4097 and DUF4098 domain-containing protein YvlB
MEQTFDTPGRSHLEVRIPAGSIRIRAEETLQTNVSIHGERAPEDFRIVMDDLPGGGHHLTVEYRERNKRFGWRSGDLRVNLTVPLGTLVACDTGSADLEVTGTIGALTFRSGSGDCRFHDVDGDVSIKGASGDVVGATVGGGLSFTSASGDVRIRQIVGATVGKGVSGDVSLGMVGGSAHLASVSGDVEIGSVATGSTSIRSVSGDVEIGVARGARVYLDISSTSGETACDLDMTDPEGGSGGSGGPDLELQVGTVSGDIRVVRSTTAANADR